MDFLLMLGVHAPCSGWATEDDDPDPDPCRAVSFHEGTFRVVFRLKSDGCRPHRSRSVK